MGPSCVGKRARSLPRQQGQLGARRCGAVQWETGKKLIEKLVSLLAFLLVLLLAPAADLVQGGEVPSRVMVGYGAISAVSTGVWVAREARTFEKYGLDAALLYVASASKMDQTVLAGDVHVALTGGSSVVDAVLAAADLVVIGGVFNTPAFYIMGRPEIKTVADLKREKSRCNSDRILDRLHNPAGLEKIRSGTQQGCGHPAAGRDA